MKRFLRLPLRICLLLVCLVIVGFSTNGANAEPIPVRIRKNVMMPARDGVRLATDVYLPDGEPTPKGPFPTILIRTPYDKSGLEATAEYFTKFGYAVVAQDVRGRFASEGEFYIYTGEGPDGFDAVEWAARQAWSNGQIGTYGGSYLAAVQNALVVLRPPHLKTMFVLVGTSNYIEDGAGRGGAFALLHNMAYGFRLASTGKSSKIEKENETKTTPAGRALDQAYRQLGDWLNSAPLKHHSPLMWTPSYRKWYADWRKHPAYDEYWKQLGYNFEEYYDRYPDIPICFVGGWYDIFKRGTLKNYQGLSRRKSYTRLLMGPWTHSTGITHAGDVDFGKSAKMNLKQEAVRWFDQFLKGEDRNIKNEPPVKYFVMGAGNQSSKTSGLATKNSAGRLQSGGVWKTAPTWPPPQSRPKRYYLQSDGGLKTSIASDSRQKTYSRFEYDPRHPVPTIGGNIDSGKHLVRRGAQNQTLLKTDFAAENQLPLSSRPDVLTFQTEPLQHDVEAAGPVRVELCVSSSVVDTDFTAKLIDVYPPSDDYPAGYAMNLEDGILRMRFRNRPQREEFIKPGQVYKIEIDLWATANRFRKGHRIRLDISSSNFPMYDVNPNTGQPLGGHTHLLAAQNTVYHDEARPSALFLHVADE